MQINTVTGKIDINELGETLFHEHIICTAPEFQRIFPDFPPRRMAVDIAVKKLKYAADKFGVKSIFDVTPLALGRDTGLLKEVSEKSGVQIVSATGFYHYTSFTLYKLSVSTLTAFLLEDIERSGVGLLKCAVDANGLTPMTEKSLEVIADVHKHSGLPVYIHTHAASRTGVAAQEFLALHGVPAEKTVIGHVSDANEPEYPLKLLKKGCFVSVDRIHSHNAKFIFELVKSGFSDKIMVSHDHICCMDTIIEKISQNAPFGLDTVHGKILPELGRLGVGHSEIKQLTNDNIARLFQSSFS